MGRCLITYSFIWLRRARQAKAFLGSFAPPKEMNRKTRRAKNEQRIWQAKG
jgi:hypothetical protein